MSMCGRCGGDRKVVVIGDTYFLRHYCFSLPFGFDWVIDPQPAIQEERQQ
jgi:hypothetical protein